MTKCIKMKISPGGKIRNYMSFAQREFMKEERRLITFSGSGEAVSKVISCVEILKRKQKDLYQINKIFFKMKEDFWEPKQEDLDRLKVTRHIPAISVLLSKDPLNAKEPGYQAPGSFDEDWGKQTAQANAKRRENMQKKRTRMQQGGGGSGRRERQKNKGAAGQSEQGNKKHKQGQNRNKNRQKKQMAPPKGNPEDKKEPKTEG